MVKTSRKHNYLRVVPLLILFMIIGAMTAEAATYYVATTGNDAYVCTTAQAISTPKRTIKSGVACLKPGDKLYIRAGTYTEQIDLATPNKTGTAGYYITIGGYPGERPTIRYSEGTNGWGVIRARGNRGWLIFENLILDGALSGNRTGWQITEGNHDFILRNLEIKNFKFNGLYVEANNVKILNCKIHHQVWVNDWGGDNRWYGIYFHHGANGVIEGNEIYNNPGGGIHAYPGTISNLIIRGNRIHDNNTMTTSSVEGIIVFRGSSYGVLQTISGVQIYNNLVYKNSISGGTSGGIRVSNGPDGTKIWNNTVYANKGWGINIQAGTSRPTNTVVQNNIVFANTSGQIANAGTGSIVNANLTTDPRFVNASAADFNLQTSSPAINKGVILSLVKTDIRSVSRPKGSTHDIGAYEVQ
jgi:parallel beta-helix repeat protein